MSTGRINQVPVLANLQESKLFCTGSAPCLCFGKESSSRSWCQDPLEDLLERLPRRLSPPMRQAYDYWQDQPGFLSCFARVFQKASFFLHKECLVVRPVSVLEGIKLQIAVSRHSGGSLGEASCRLSQPKRAGSCFARAFQKASFLHQEPQIVASRHSGGSLGEASLQAQPTQETSI